MTMNNTNVDEPIESNRKRTMSDTFIPAALDEAGLSPSTFRVFCHISRRGKDCWESLDAVARVCRIRRETAQKALKELVELGFILLERRDGKTNMYRVNPAPKIPPLPSPPNTRGKIGATKVPLSLKVPLLKGNKTGDSANTPIVSSKSKPESVQEVVEHSLVRRGYKGVSKWLKGVNLNATTGEILHGVNDNQDLTEGVLLALRFIRFNTRNGWQLTHSWQAAFDGFESTCHDGSGGVSDVPMDWIPEIISQKRKQQNETKQL